MAESLAGRRRFLKTAGAGLAGGAFLAAPAIHGEDTTGKARAAALPVCDVQQFGAKGDGIALDTGAINRAIEAAAERGGGTVWFPAGDYLCYSIHLKSNVTLYLATGAAIVAARPRGGTDVYDAAESNQPWEPYQDYGHNHWHNSLLWGEGLHNVAIQGPGLIWGKGLSRGWNESPRAEDPGEGNKAISLKNCRNVTLRDFAILSGGHFGILATGVDNLTIDNLVIDTNRDGMDIDCCRNVRVSNCTVNSPWDDGICLKSSFGLGYARSTDMVTIANCLLLGSYHVGSVIDGSWKPFTKEELVAQRVSRNGRIKFGTESNGGFRNITVTNCVFEGCRGFALESVDGALLEDVAISNLTMRDIVDAPLFFRLGSRMRGPKGVAVGTLRRVSVSNVVCSHAAGPISSIFAGLAERPIEDVRIRDVYIQHTGGGTASDAARPLEENEKKYPEPSMFGTTPSQGFYIRHVKGLEMSGVKVTSLSPDARPCFVLKDVEDAGFFHVQAPSAPSRETFRLEEVRAFSVGQSRPIADTYIEKAAKQAI